MDIKLFLFEKTAVQVAKRLYFTTHFLLDYFNFCRNDITPSRMQITIKMATLTKNEQFFTNVVFLYSP